MAKYRKISPRIWNDAKVRNLSDKGKLAFLFLLTHPNISPFGAIRANIPGLAFELGWSAKAFGKALAELADCGMARVGESLVWLPNFLKYNKPESPNVIKSWPVPFEDLPECDLLEDIRKGLINMAKSLGKAYLEAFVEAFSEAFGQGFMEGFDEGLQEGLEQPSPNQEQDQEQEIKRQLNTHPNPSQARGMESENPNPEIPENKNPPPGLRQAGTNPRATGANPRAQGVNPRATGDNPRAQKGEKTGNTLPELKAAMREYTANPELLQALEDWRLMRERIRKPLNGRALQIAFGKLDSLAEDDAGKIALLEQSIFNSWQGIFPLKEPEQARSSPERKTFAQMEAEWAEEQDRKRLERAREYDRQRELEAQNAANGF